MSIGIKDLETALADYKDLLTFQIVENDIVVKVKEYIRNKETWSKITAIIRSDYGGKYVAKDQGGSEWRVPLEPAQTSDIENLSFHCPYCNKLINVKVE